MVSAAEQTREALRADFILQEVIAREIVSPRKVARYLREHRGVEGTLDAIAQAIYDLELEPHSDAVGAALELLGESSVELRQNLAAIVVESNGHAAQRISRLMGRVATGSNETLRVFSEQDTLTFVLDSQHLPDAKKIFEESGIVDTVEDLNAVTIGPLSDDLASSKLLDLALTTLTLQGIIPRFVNSGYSEHSIPVPAEEGQKAFQAIKQLRDYRRD